MFTARRAAKHTRSTDPEAGRQSAGRLGRSTPERHVHLAGLAPPIVRSRSEAAILSDMNVLGSRHPSPRSRRSGAHPLGRVQV
jgi:hypothetical protein